MLASPVSDDIFLFIAADAASEAESAATGETTDVVPGGEAAPLPAVAALEDGGRADEVGLLAELRRGGGDNVHLAKPEERGIHATS